MVFVLLKNQNQNQVAEVKSELEDRFGPLPEPVCNLLQISELRVLAQNQRIEKLLLEDGKIAWEYSAEVHWNQEKIKNLAKRIEGPVEFKSQQGLKVVVTTAKKEVHSLPWLKKLLQTG